MTISPLMQAIDAAGGRAALATKLGIGESAIGNWVLRTGFVPVEKCAAVESMTGVRCETLRPDIKWMRDNRGRLLGYYVPLKAA